MAPQRTSKLQITLYRIFRATTPPVIPHLGSDLSYSTQSHSRSARKFSYNRKTNIPGAEEPANCRPTKQPLTGYTFRNRRSSLTARKPNSYCKVPQYPMKHKHQELPQQSHTWPYQKPGPDHATLHASTGGQQGPIYCENQRGSLVVG